MINIAAKGLRQSRLHNIFVSEIYFTQGDHMNQQRRSIGVHLRMTCAPLEADSLLSALQDLQRLSREEPGNRMFDILQCCEHAGGFLVLEEFENGAALATHRASDHFRRFKEATASLTLTIERYAPV
ncbi:MULTISPECIES: putative quinol monooxygenase [unclassified Agrobacterium]|uniref:putative quinol monooxygenase n=1 Tax=unclassified Agrobacterium TaxID=2632611 RepID=UPI001F208F7C|nr:MULTISPECIES: antibiotic biosynthesis monooxygenase [unclassified Agrobacterium]